MKAMSEILPSLASFVPARVLRRFAANPAPLAGPELERLPGAVLLADIAGFSPLAELLGQRGPAGAEDLTAMLNAYFERLIALIQAHGGDVMKFAGDALLALWEAADGDLAAATHRAARCALAIQNELHGYAVAEGVRLSIHSGLGAGEIFVSCVGGLLGRWELLVTGTPLIQMSLAAKHAQSGEVVVSREAWGLIGVKAHGVPLATSDWRLQSVDATDAALPAGELMSSAAAEAALRGFIPKAILTRIAAGQGAWLAELRRATVLFVNLPDLIENIPLKLAQSVMTAMQSAIYRYEGSVNQLGADDKGITLVAALGLPPLAHEDDAFRGIQAAQTIQARLRELGVRSAIGVTTGRIFCGTVGSEHRRQYALIGDTVNLAARLMQAAPGDILCDAATFSAVGRKIRFEALAPLPVKARAEPVEVFRPYCHGTLFTGQRTMFGRAAERAVLMTALEALKAGTSGVILIEGDAGIGKSRLLADFESEAAVRNVVVYAGAGDAIEKTTPHHAWQPLFRQLFEIEVHSSAEERRAQVFERLRDAPESVRMAPLLNGVLALDLPDNDATAGLNGQVRADNTNELLIGLLQTACGTRPTALVLEDAHWVDSASWALALLAVRRLHPALLVIAARPLDEAAPAESRKLLEAANLQRLRLEALDSSEMSGLVCERLGVASLPATIAALIQAKTQGNPFFSEELAYALRDSGTILIAEGQCRVAPGVDLKTVHFPDSVQGVITGRMDRLPPSEQLTLKVASVIGRIFALRILRDIYPIEPERAQLPAYLQTLERLDLTPLETPDPDLAYIFKHVITQEVAYNLMLFAQRRQLHRAVAEWYERTEPRDLAPFYPLLAHHWQHAENGPKALTYLEKAGEQALRAGTYAEAVNFFTAFLSRAGKADLAPANDPIRGARVWRQLGVAHLGLGALDQSREYFEKTVRALGFPVPHGRVALGVILAIQMAAQFGHRVRPPALARTLSAAQKERRLHASRAYEQLAVLYYFANDTWLTFYASLRALNLSEDVGACPELARSYATMGICASIVPLHALARKYLRMARDTAARVQDQSAISWVLQLCGMYSTAICDWEETEVAFRRASAIASEVGDRRRWMECTCLFGSFHHFRGRFTERLPIEKDVFRIATESGDQQGKFWALGDQAESLISLGRFSESLQMIEAARELMMSNVGYGERLWLHGLLAVTQLRLGRMDLARKAAEEADRLISAVPPAVVLWMEGYAGPVTVWLALAEAAATDSAERAALLRRGAAACREMEKFAGIFPIGRPRARLFRGGVEWLAGRETKAHATWRKSLEAGELLAMPYEQGLAHYEIGRHLPTGDSERRPHLEKAAEIFARLSASFDLGRARAAAAAD
ncbi:MAG: hypothetical protein QOE70_1369 [Chthoniobacter sp.]|jgi:class 3 adenylate cyclase/tetratricopeptide (TPR) repeat protein|nr:hypothetical protein [Chthoniobacter sp.]